MEIGAMFPNTVAVEVPSDDGIPEAAQSEAPRRRGRPRIYSDEERVERMKFLRNRWMEAHREEHRAWDREYIQKPEVKQRRLQWARDNKEAINAKRRRRYRELHPRPENPEQVVS